MEHFVIIMVDHNPPHPDEIPSVLATAIDLIDKHRIHPDHLRVTRWESHNDEWGASPLFDLSTYTAILPFLERGLTPQIMVNGESFYNFGRQSERIADIVLEYGDGKLRFPLARSSPITVRYPILRGRDPDEVVDENNIYCVSLHIENLLFLAFCGYNFHRRDSQGWSRLDFIGNYYGSEHRTRVEDAIRVYAREVKEAVGDVLIPDIGDIVYSYLQVS